MLQKMRLYPTGNPGFLNMPFEVCSNTPLAAGFSCKK